MARGPGSENDHQAAHMARDLWRAGRDVADPASGSRRPAVYGVRRALVDGDPEKGCDAVYRGARGEAGPVGADIHNGSSHLGHPAAEGLQAHWPS
jgi:hypothetical protein